MLKLSKNAIGMLIAKYRTVLLQMLRKEGVALAVSGLLLAVPAPVLAADYAVGAGQAYVSLEALRTAGAAFTVGDTITLYQDDISLTAPFSFGGAAVILQTNGTGTVTLKPSANNIRLFTVSSGSVTLASTLVIEGFVNTATGDAGRGGALRIENGASVDAQNATFKNNQAIGGFDVNNVYSGGGAVFVTGADSQLNAVGAIFQDNQAAANGGIGGALYIRASGAATANNATFTGNSAHFGGGVYVTGSSTLSIDNAAFTNNTASTSGGAGYLGGSSATANGAQFTGNTARWGGALYLANSSTLTANNAVFTGNQATKSGGDGGYGGAVFITDSTFNLDNAAFANNTASISGGAGYVSGSSATANGAQFTGNTARWGGALYLENSSILTANNAVFTGNQANESGGSGGYGGAVKLNASTLTANNAVFSNNSASIVGGAVNMYNSSFTATGAQFTGNTAIQGGAVYLDGGTFSADNASFSSNTTTQEGGALYVVSVVHDDTTNTDTAGVPAVVTLNNAVFTNNQASNGGAAMVGTGGILQVSNAQFTGNAATNGVGGAIFLHVDVGDATVNINTDAGKTTLFSGNTQQVGSAPASANSIFFNGRDNYTTYLNVDGDGLLDMRDPLDSDISHAAYVYNIAIAKNGAGIWKLGGDNQLRGTSTTFAVNAGTLDLYNNAALTISQGTFTLGSGATLISRGANSISATTIDLNTGSTTAVDLSGGNSLTLNGAVTIGTGATLDISGYSQGTAAVAVKSSQAIIGNFTSLTVGGQTLSVSPPSLSKFINDATLYKTAADTQINVLLGGLVWNNTGSGQAHGTFDITSSFTVADALADNTATAAYGFGWNGKTLTKTGSGTLTLSGANTYTGGTTVEAGKLVFAGNNSAIQGDTTVKSGSELALTDGATYGAADNTGSFTLENAARLSADATGGTVNAGTVSLKDGSVTTVDVSSGKLLILNGNVTIENGAVIDVNGYSTTLADVVTSSNTITGNFTSLKLGGVDQNQATPTIDKFVNSIFLSKTNGDKTITIKQGGLVWNNTDPGTAHGTFKVETDYTLGESLADNTATAAYGFGWNGKTLTKTGSGTLTLSGANTYTGGTIIDRGTLTADTLSALGSGAITNNATLAFFRSGATAGQTIAFGNRYAGSGTLGIQASLTAAAQWSDLLTFDNAPTASNGVYFTFTDGSNLRYMPKEGLHFAELTAANGTDGTFSLAGTSLAGASQLSIKTTDNQNYYLTSSFNPSLGKVYSETAAAGLGQAASLHGTETFGAIGKAAAGATGGDTGVYAGGGRSDARHNTGSHADVQGNNLALALAWEKGKTTYGVIGQTFDGSYTTTHQASVGGSGQTIHSAGDLKQHDLGLFAEYRPDDSGRYWQALVKGGSSKNDFRADNAQGGSRFRSDRDVFGLSLGGGYVKQTGPGHSLETYQHLIYTRLGSDQVTDSIGQDIRFDANDSMRLLAGARWTLKQEGKPSFYAGAALDYEFRGKTGATIDGNQADGANLQGLTGILELGFSAKQSETLSLDGALYGYVGKKEGLAGSLTLTKRF